MASRISAPAVAARLVMRRSALSLATATARCRLCSSKADGLRGATSLLTPEERDKQGTGVDPSIKAAHYQRQKEQPPPDEATARIIRQQQERMSRAAGDRKSAYNPGMTVSKLSLDGQFAAMEKAGEFKNLPGHGKPLPERHHTHFGGEDAMDAMLQRIMAEHKCLPESLELRNEYMATLKSFRLAMERWVSKSTVTGGESAKPLKRSAMEAQMSELRKLQKRFETAAVKDSITYNFPINPLPKVASTIDEEMVEARRRATEKKRKDDEEERKEHEERLQEARDRKRETGYYRPI